MIKHKLTYNSGGSEIASDSIVSFSLSESVNDSTDLSIGSVCAAKIDVQFRAKDGLTLPPYGNKIKVYEALNDGEFFIKGVFYVESVKQTSKKTYRIVAYDCIGQLEKDVSDVIDSIEVWPSTVSEIVTKVANSCGIRVDEKVIPGWSMKVQRFSAPGIKARTICKWAAQVSGTFCKASPYGKILFDWYKISHQTISDGSSSGSIVYYADSLKRQPYETDLISAVQIKTTSKDVGTRFPTSNDVKNVLTITGNLFLVPNDNINLHAIAERLYNLVKNVKYTPAEVSIPSELKVDVGDIVTVKSGGKASAMYIMSRSESGSRDTLKCTGNQNRDSSSSISENRTQYFEGKLFEYQRSIDGLEIRAQQTEASVDEAVKKVNELSVTVDGFSSRISSVETSNKSTVSKLNELTSTVDGFSSRVSSVETSNKQTVEKVSKVEQTVNSVSASVAKKVDADSGTWATFGWELFSDRWEIRANNKVLMKVTRATGLEIDGKVTARSGQIGNATIKEYTPSNDRGGYLKIGGLTGYATYIGEPNKSLYDKYVIMSGKDDDVEEKYSFRVSAKGELFSTSGKIGGWDIGADSLSTLGATWAHAPEGGIYIGPAGINLSENFFVSKNGNLTARNGRFYGNVYAKGIQYGSDAGYVSGKCLSTNSVTSSEVSVGINNSLGYANFSDDVFNNRLEAPSVKAAVVHAKTYWSRDHLLKEKSATVRLADGTTEVINYMSWY